MELKIVCGCGQKYKFEVEPVNGRMPVKVACPSCGADGTGSANQILAQYFPNRPAPVTVISAGPAVAPASPPVPPPIAAPAPVGGVRVYQAGSTPAPLGAQPPLPAPARPIAPLKPVAAKTKLTWYQYIWIGLPLVMIFLGGCIGGACGGAAAAINYTVFQKVSNPVLKYVWTGVITAGAFVLWFIIIALLLGLLGGLRGR